MKWGRWMIGVVAVVAIFFATGGEARSKEELEDRIGHATAYFRELQASEDTRIPDSVLERAKGIIILRQYKGAFVFGFKYGHGIAMARDPETGKWSAPAFVRTTDSSLGFQVGGQAIDGVIVVTNDNGVDILKGSRFKIGGDASVAVGAVGRAAEAKIGPETAFLSYSKTQGAFAGVAAEWGWVTNSDTNNRKYYGIDDLKGKQILFEKRVAPPASIKKLHNMLK